MSTTEDDDQVALHHVRLLQPLDIRSPIHIPKICPPDFLRCVSPELLDPEQMEVLASDAGKVVALWISNW